MPTITANGSELYYERRGEGEPLLMIMGMSGHTLHWGEPFLTALERDFELILYDHRGVGRSAANEAPFTIAHLADDAIALLDALEIERAHVLGISMGGMVAQELALSAPERVLTLTLGSTYCGGTGSQFTDDAVVRQLAMVILSGDADRIARTGWDVSVSAEYATAAGNFERFAAVAGQYPVAAAVTMLQVQAVMGHDASQRLAQITAPTLVVHGDADRMLGHVNGEQIAQLIPGSRLELLPGVGHLFFWECPERSAELVVQHAAPARS